MKVHVNQLKFQIKVVLVGIWMIDNDVIMTSL